MRGTSFGVYEIEKSKVSSLEEEATTQKLTNSKERKKNGTRKANSTRKNIEKEKVEQKEEDCSQKTEIE